MNFAKGLRRSFSKHPQVGRHVNGFTLIEVLVTVVVISIGMLSIAQLQARALQHSHSSLQRTVAVVQANDLLERMWSGYCSPAFPQQIFQDWIDDDAVSGHPLLPEWGATLDPPTWDGTTPNPEFTLTISWQDLRSRDNTEPSFTYIFRMLDPDLSC